MSSNDGRRHQLTLAVGAIGVVFGDIGTSPLYALRECFSLKHGIAVRADNILGIVSLLIWTLSLIVCVKYLMIVLRQTTRAREGYSLSSAWYRAIYPRKANAEPDSWRHWGYSARPCSIATE